MAHQLSSRAAGDAEMAAALRSDPVVRQARIDLAACLRMAARLGMAEGICNHFSATLPGHPGLFLVNPLGLAFCEVTASRLLVCHVDGRVVDGDGEPEATAFFIHARLHLRKPAAVAAFHTHMPNATALAMVDGEPLAWAGQTALKFYGRVATVPFNGLALDEREGDRIADAMGDADIAFLRNHGVMVTAPNIAQAWDDLYYLERAAEVQVRADSTGRRLLPVAPDIAALCAQQMREGDPESARLHLASIHRQLARLEPDYLD
ncbi:aldolase [Cupriavidus gilardii]|uniref:aldolase n=1 Tax=Cupriavidus gilardii TaxID=82541 RepID=UPI001ABE9ADD|nr:aldolase [Cupriavidus gilardii]MBO4123223.1 aldolase [Cupriavidus gilardii]